MCWTMTHEINGEIIFLLCVGWKQQTSFIILLNSGLVLKLGHKIGKVGIGEPYFSPDLR